MANQIIKNTTETEEPKVSIIIPNFNREKFVEETMNCVRKIKYSNWECIVVDDGSTDNSVSVIKEAAKSDERFKCFFNEKTTHSEARNFGIKQSTGKYILPLDSDDLIHPKYVPEAVEILERNPSIKVVYCKGKYFGDKHGRWKLPPYSFVQLISQNCLPSASLFRRSDFDKTYGYNPHLSINEDWEFWISLLETGGDVYRIPKYYFYYRKHKNSVITNNRNKELESIQLIYELHKETYDKTLEHPILLSRKMLKYKRKYNKYRRLTLRKPIP